MKISLDLSGLINKVNSGINTSRQGVLATQSVAQEVLRQSVGQASQLRKLQMATSGVTSIERLARAEALQIFELHRHLADQAAAIPAQGLEFGCGLVVRDVVHDLGQIVEKLPVADHEPFWRESLSVLREQISQLVVKHQGQAAVLDAVLAKVDCVMQIRCGQLARAFEEGPEATRTFIHQAIASAYTGHRLWWERLGFSDYAAEGLIKDIMRHLDAVCFSSPEALTGYSTLDITASLLSKPQVDQFWEYARGSLSELTIHVNARLGPLPEGGLDRLLRDIEWGTRLIPEYRSSVRSIEAVASQHLTACYEAHRLHHIELGLERGWEAAANGLFETFLKEIDSLCHVVNVSEGFKPHVEAHLRKILQSFINEHAGKECARLSELMTHRMDRWLWSRPHLP